MVKLFSIVVLSIVLLAIVLTAYWLIASWFVDSVMQLSAGYGYLVKVLITIVLIAIGRKVQLDPQMLGVKKAE